ncbi:MFS general substrate transporter [Aspergillus campestris IBT 28561]|uniref:MFS general substrate transporter n=1 Tax=Aspergillus campestris (strain IBT 28561) TaxID=1392248 RepID=A0A2I1CU51_ASPC2|nr:MFS general substrate transporter [Aspergillus campestris IBT 28561]PKY01145.1 MFS general substrate transporter [Aspergillus campestris IBT 28561]
MLTSTKAVAVGYREYREGLHMEVSHEDVSLKVRWKIDFVVLPIFMVTQALQSMDKTALNYANLLGYQESLGLRGEQFNFLSAMVYAGYFFGQYPSGLLIGRFPAQRVLGISCFLWGITVIVMTQCRTYSSALAIRFIMGLFEAAATPGLTLMTGFWYTRKEIPLRQCIWCSSLGWGGIVVSYVCYGISTLPATFKPDRWALLFYILGGTTCLWALVIWFVLPDSPSDAFFLTRTERVIAVKRVSTNETGIKNRVFNQKQVMTCLKDPKAILLFISIFAGSVPSGVLNCFSTVIIKDMGFSVTKTTQLKSVGDAVQIVALLIGGTITLKVPNSRLLTVTASNVICTVAAACMAYIPRHETWARLASFWLVNVQSIASAVLLVTVSSNMAGYTHRAIANTIVFTAYCSGHYASPFVVKPSQAPAFKGAAIGLLVGFTIKAACDLALLAYMYSVNRGRDKKYGPADKALSDEAGMKDQTEFENKNFRYVL